MLPTLEAAQAEYTRLLPDHPAARILEAEYRFRSTDSEGGEV